MSELNPFSQDSGMRAGNDNDDMYAPASYEALGPNDYNDSAAFGDADVLSAQNRSSTFDETFGEDISSPLAKNGDDAYGSSLGRIGDSANDNPFNGSSSAASKSAGGGGLLGGKGYGSDNNNYNSGREFGLDERERKLEAREAELNRRLQDLEGKLEKQGPARNWPFPPVVLWAYHDIGAEIPPEHKAMCRTMYTIWWMGIATVWYNCVLLTGGVLAGVDDAGVLSVILSVFYAFITSSLSWTLWYRSIYYAFRDGKTRRWLFFFIWFGLFLAWMIFYVIGIPQTGHNGLIKMLDAFTSRNTSYGMALLAHTILASLCLLGGVLMIIRVHRLYRSSGAHERAKQDATRELVKGAVNHSEMVA